MSSTLLALRNPEAVKFIKTSLKDKGMNLTQAKDGAAAMSKLDEDSFGLVLTEKDLPKIGWLEFINHVQVKHPWAKVVIISE
ncbi:MAG: response regulator, partial [Deltaproteobacteria bacterium]|nr:response regulator [Deltaproteobacteria bacterium]